MNVRVAHGGSEETYLLLTDGAVDSVEVFPTFGAARRNALEQVAATIRALERAGRYLRGVRMYHLEILGRGRARS